MDQLPLTSTEKPAPKKARAAFVSLYSCSLVRDARVKVEDRTVTVAREAANMVRVIVGDSDREHFVALVLDCRRRVIGAQVVSVGTLNASLVHPREVFKPAIMLNGAAVIVAHNHPSGEASPSAEDRDVTRRLVRAGELLGIPVVDHVIIGAGETFYSFRDAGLL